MEEKIDKSNVSGIFELSFVQKGMLYHHLKEEQGHLYNVQLSLQIEGPLQPARLEEAFYFLQKENESLRSVFAWEKINKPLQIFLKACPVDFIYQDLSPDKREESGGTINDTASLAEAFLEADKKRRFDLTKLPLRLSVLKTSAASFLLVITHHHILYDGWSTGIFLKELFSIYHRISQGQSPDPVAKPSFGQVREAMVRRNDPEKGLSFWNNYLKGYEITPFFSKNTSVPTPDDEIEKHSFTVPRKQLENLSGKYRVTIASIIYASYGILLQKYFSTQDVVFGTVVSGRDAEIAGSDKIMGNFVNTIPLRLTTTAPMTCEQLIEAVNREWIDRSQFAYTSYFEIKESLGLRSDTGLFDSVVVIENYPLDKALTDNNAGLNIRLNRVYEHTDIPLVITVFFREQLEIEMTWKRDSIGPLDTDAFAGCFKTVLLSVAAGMDQPVQSLSLLREGERHKILKEFNAAGSMPVPDTGAIRFFEEQVSQNPGSVAVIFGDEQLTYGELSARSSQLGHHLLAMGVKEESLVAICMERSAEMIVGILGILKAGKAYVPIDPRYPANRIAYMLNDIRAEIVLTDRKSRNLLPPSYTNNVLVLPDDGNEIKKRPSFCPPISTRADHLVYVMYTSGSTGRPKGVMVTHGNLISLVKDERLMTLQSSDRLLSTGSPSFDATTFEYWGMLLNGGTLVLCPEENLLDVDKLRKALEDNRINIMWMTASWLNQLVDTAIGIFGGLSVLIAGGEKLSEIHMARLREQYPGLVLINGYGPTENTTFSLTYKINAVEKDTAIPIGRPLKSRTAYILDEQGQLMPVGVGGELYVGGAGVSRGYLGMPELTAERFVADPFGPVPGGRLYRTGDWCRWLPDGNIAYLGRMDKQIKMRGFRIELEEISRVVEESGLVRQAVVVVQEDVAGKSEKPVGPAGSKRLIGYVVTDGPFDQQGVLSYLKARLPEYMVPSAWVALSSLPLTENGKLDRRLLPEPEWSTGKEYVAPSGETEERLAEIWKEILPRSQDPISVTAGFFEQGGNSISSILLVSKIMKGLGIRIGVRDVFDHPTIQQLARHIREMEKTLYTPIPTAPLQDHYKLSFAQQRLYFLHEYDPSSITYNVHLLMPLHGPADAARVKKAFYQLVARQEILRTSFVLMDDQPVQKVLKELDFDIEVLTADKRPAAAVIRDFKRPFDLARPPLFRIAILENSPDDNTVLLDLHHIISDKMSNDLLQREFNQLYEGKKLPDLKGQYKDYAEWQQDPRQLAAIVSQQSHWMTTLQGALPVLALPADFKRTDKNNDRGAVVSIYLTPRELTLLEKYSRRYGMTAPMLFHASFNILLAALSGQKDIIIGFSVAGRNHPELENVIGVFVNSLAIRSFPEATKSLPVFLLEIRSSILAAYDNQDYPFDMLVDQLGWNREKGRNPIFDVMLNFMDQSTVTAGVNEAEMQQYRHDDWNRMFDLTLHVVKFADTIHLQLQYDRGLFLPATAEKYLTCFRNILSGLEEHRDQELGAISLEKEETIEEVRRQLQDYTGISLPANERLTIFHPRGEPLQAVNIPLIIHFETAPDQVRLEQNIRDLAGLHDVLRTAISQRGDLYYLKPEAVAYVILQKEEPIKDENEVHRRIEQWINQSFGPDQPLFRACLFPIENDTATLALAFHCLIVDRYSVYKLAADLLAGVSSGEKDKKSGPPLQYSGFYKWQHEVLPALDLHFLSYWKRQLRDPGETLKFPTDHPKAAVRTYTPGMTEIKFSSALTDRLLKEGLKEGRQIRALLMAAFKTLLYKYCGQTEWVIGTRIDNRKDGIARQVIGPVSNLIAVKSAIVPDSCFMDYAAALQRTLEEGARFGDMPFDRLVKEVAPESNGDGNPFFDMLFCYEESNGYFPLTANAAVSIPPAAQQGDRYELNLFIQLKGEELEGKLIYNSDHYEASTMDSFARYYQEWLERLLTAPRQKFSELSILSAKEIGDLLGQYDRTDVGYPRAATLTSLFREQVRRTPDGIAVQYEDHSVTYRQLDRHSDRLAARLKEKGVAAGMIVALLTDRSIDLISSMLGILKAGAAYLPIDSDYPADRIAFMLKDSRTSFLLTTRNTTVPADESITVLYMDDTAWVTDEAFPEMAFGLPENHEPSDCCYIIYTSGTTGNPKGVMVEHRNVVRLFFNDRFQFDFNEKDVWTMFHSHCFDFSVWEIYGALLFGGKLIVIPKMVARDTRSFLELLIKDRVTILNQTPSAFYNLMREDGSGSAVIPALRFVIFGGEALSPGRLKAWKSKYPAVRLINMFGITETTVHVTYKEIGEKEMAENRSNIGTPIPTLSLYLFDPGQKPVPQGIVGELYVGGAGVARGYLFREQLTHERFVPHPYAPGERLYRTGDLARMLPTGEIEYLGRIDHQIQLRGFRIEQGEIENKLASHPAIKECVVLARGKEENTTLAAYYISEQEIKVSALREWLTGQLPDYMVPSYYVHLDKWPVTANGKLDKDALPAPVIKGEEDDHSAPMTLQEHLLVDIWSKVLDIGTVGVTDNFFSIGGDSIKSIQISARLRNEGYDISVKDIFNNQTIRDLAPQLKKITADSGSSPVIGKAPATPIQRWLLGSRTAERNHFNQSVLLQAREELPAEVVRQIFEKMLRHHDALRMKLVQDHDRLWLENMPEGDPVHLEEFDWKQEKDAAAMLLAASNRIQAGIGLEQGPLLRLGLFHLKEGSRLLIVIHHLVVDGVSWRILLEDMATLYRQVTQRATLMLPPKTSSFLSWARLLREYPKSPAFQDALPYWKNFLRRKPTIGIQRDRPDECNTFGDIALESFRLEKEATEKLLTEVHTPFRTRINDILLTALLMTFTKQYGRGSVKVDLEGHGREEVQQPVNITRTIGWFTTIFPILLESSAQTLSAMIQEVKENLRQIPHQGFDYLFLRCPDDAATPSEDPERPASIPYPEDPAAICFNYLGQFDQEGAHGPFLPAFEPVGSPVSPRMARKYDWDISCMVTDRQLEFSLSYSSRQYDPEPIRSFVLLYRDCLLELIAYCSSYGKVALTPSDLSYSHLTQDQLNALQKQYAVEDIYPLSPMQEGLLFHSLLDARAENYLDQKAMEIEGTLDIEEVERSVNGLVDRYDVFRTIFLYEGYERPLQMVLKTRKADFTYKDIRDELKEDPAETVIDRYLAEDRAKKTDLAKDALFRVTVLRTGEEKYELIWSTHHIITDGWCSTLIWNDFVSLYSGAGLNGAPAGKYAEYINWLENRDKAASLAYWTRYLAGYANGAGLPKKETTAAARSPYSQGRQNLLIGRTRTKSLQSLAADKGLTLNTLFRSAWAILLGIYNDTEDIVFGSVVSGRPAQIDGIEKRIGLFINTIPVRVRIVKDDTVAGLLAEVQRQAAESEPYQYHALSEVNALGDKQGGLFDHILVFQNYPVANDMKGFTSARNGSENTIKNLRTFFEQSDYDLVVNIAPNAVIRVGIDYNRNVYDDRTIAAVLSFLDQIIDGFLDGLDVPISDMAAPPRQKTVIDLFDRQANEIPYDIAFEAGGASVTYGALKDKADRIAAGLQEAGVRPGDLVGILLGRDEYLLPSIIGTLKAGAAYVPIDPAYPPARKEFIIADARLKVMLTRNEYSSDLPAAGPVMLDPRQLEAAAGAKNKIHAGTLPDALAYVIYTSGSTGTPKGVMIRHRSLANYIRWAAKNYIREEQAVFPLFTSISFDLTITSIFAPLTTGNKIVIYQEDQKELLIDRVLANPAINIIKLTPSHLRIMKDLPLTEELLRGPVKKLIVGGEELTAQLAGDIHHNFKGRIEIYNEYGPTEATVGCMIHRYDPAEALLSVPIGIPIDNTRIYLLNKSLKAVPPEVIGELYIGGEGLASGYLNNDSLTASRFIPDPFINGEKMYKTGDLAVKGLDGKILFKGRIDDQVKLKGFRIEPGEIEYLLSGHPGITGAAVAVRGKDDDRYLVAWYKAESPVDPAELKRYLSEKLPEFMLPAQYMQIDSLPLTANGKLDKQALPEPEPDRDAPGDYIAPSGKTEEKLVEIWSEVLKLDKAQISVTRSFLELGGHSLKTILMLNKVSKQLNVRVPINEVFERRHIRGLALYIEEKDKQHYSAIGKSPVKEYYQLSSAQKRLYFLYEFDRTSLAYNMPKILRLEGTLDKDRLSLTFNRIIARHESLRTSFEVIDQEPLQKITGQANFTLEYFQCKEADVLFLLKKMIRPFDLNKGPLIRAGLIEVSAENHLLLIDMHHIITDGVSQMILIKDFMSLYSQEELPALRLQYKDYAEWQQNDRQQDGMDRQQKFWIGEYPSAPPILELPSDFSRPSIKSYEGSSMDFGLEHGTLGALKKVADKEGATLFMVILSVYAVLLHKLSNQKDIVIGTPVAGRRHADLENMIGMFVNTLPLRNYPDSELTFREFLSKVKSNTLACFENQDYQYESMIEDLKVQRDTSRNPLFDVLFSYQNFEETELKIPGVKLMPYDNGHTVAKFDLTLTASEERDGILLNFEYSTRLFKKETIEKFTGYFQNIVSTIILDENIKILDIDMITEEEKYRILHQFNDTTGEYPRQETLVSLFERQVAATPDKTAIVYEGARLTYYELNLRANRLAHRLRNLHDIRPDEVVGIMCGRSEDMIVGLLGILKSGGAYVPIDPAYPKDRTAYILEDCGARVLLVDNELSDDFHYQGIVLPINATGNDAGSNLSPVNAPEDLCYLIYTSGSTGKPKGVMISHGNVVNFMAGMNLRLQTDKKDCMLAVTSTSFDISVLELFWTLCNGIEVVIHPADISLTSLDRYISKEELSMDFSLFFFSSYDNQDEEKYDLLLQSVKYADREAFKAVWTPERHFHEFGGLYPNPSVISSALSMVTRQIKLRSGSVVAPLHDTIRIAEEWSVVDNLSKGRVELSFASGWNPNDFSLAKERFTDRHRILYEQIEEVRNLWRGGTLTRTNGFGQEVELRIFPKPLQKELPIWITSGGSEETFVSAGKMGANLLTHFLGQDIEELARKIKLYRLSREQGGYTETPGKVAVMMHTYIGDDIGEIEKLVEGPFIEYLKSSIGLNRIINEKEGLREEDISDENKKIFLGNAFRRYYKTASLIGTKSICSTMVQKLKDIGVDEIACLVDFGLEKDKVLDGLKKLKELKDFFSRKDNGHSPITMMQSTPSFIGVAREGAGSKKFLQSLRLLLLGGESVPVSLVQRLKAEINADICNMYGPTETTIWSCMDKMAPDIGKVSIGKPILNTQIYILDKALKIVPIGVAGDLYIGGEGLSRGYWKRPGLTGTSFIPHPFIREKKIYKTGDVARWLPDGNIELIGREDLQVKIRGHRIELGEIESRLLEQHKVKEAVVVAKEENEGGGKYLACYLISEEKLDFSEVREHLAGYLPDYMIPNYFMQLEQLPLTPNGKIDRKALPDPGIRMNEEYKAPSEGTEDDLAEIWSQVLKTEKRLISADSNFFELGGHSIRAIHLINAVRSRFSVKVELRDIFENNSVRKLSRLIDRFDIEQAAAIPKVSEREYYPTSAPQKRFFYQQLWDKDSLANNTSAALAIKGELNTDRLQRSLRSLIDRHGSLRTHFLLLDDGVFQQINRDVLFELQVLDSNKYRTVKDAFRDFIKPFDLSTAPLMRCAIISYGDRENYLFLDIHHIICDGISFNILIKDFKDIYLGIEPAPIDLQYVDYSCWLNDSENKLDKQKEFWTKQLSGDLPRLNLSVGKEQDSLSFYPASTAILEMEGQRYHDVRKFTAEHKTSDFMFFLSIYYILLSKISGNSDIIIGTDVAGRAHSSVKDIVGTFVNILPLRLRIDNDQPYWKFLAEVKDCVLEAFDNQDYQFDEMVSLVAGKGGTPQSPIFDVHFSLANTLDSADDMNELQFVPVEMYRHPTTQYGFKLEVSEKKDTIRIAFIYSSDLYDDAMIEIWVQYYNNLITAVLNNSSLDIESLELEDSTMSIA